MLSRKEVSTGYLSGVQADELSEWSAGDGMVHHDGATFKHYKNVIRVFHEGKKDHRVILPGALDCYRVVCTSMGVYADREDMNPSSCCAYRYPLISVSHIRDSTLQSENLRVSVVRDVNQATRPISRTSDDVVAIVSECAALYSECMTRQDLNGLHSGTVSDREEVCQTPHFARTVPRRGRHQTAIERQGDAHDLPYMGLKHSQQLA